MPHANIVPARESDAHDSARLHVCGESEFVDDRPLLANEIHVGLVYSPHAKARITHIDAEKALKLPDVLGVFTASSLAHNSWGAIFSDQPLLAYDYVNYVGDVVMVIAAQSSEALQRAQKLVAIGYELHEPILSIEEAIKYQSFIGGVREIRCGDAMAAIHQAPHRLQGQIKLKGAEHFYLENQATIAYPLENDCLEVHCSTQHPTEVQHVVAKALGLAQHSVVTIAKRLGGGFGGKETQAAPFAVYAALAARTFNRPARLVLSKDDDMIMTGKRNPYQVDYDVGFADDGAILGLSCFFYGDGGAYADLSTSILERAMAHADNAYFIPHALIRGQVCRTNYHPHTAFRGFGGPKGVAMIEHVMEQISYELGLDALDVRMRNCYNNEHNRTPYGQEVKNNCLPQLFATLEERCSYRDRRAEITEWNKNKAHNPRGMALTAIKFGICFTSRFLNQAHALVHIHRDGSVQVATGAVEMGQGVQARIRTLVADALGIATKSVRIMPTATDKSANTSPTAASSGTDLNGAAALIAVADLTKRLAALYCQLLLEPKKENWPEYSAGLGTVAEIELDQAGSHDVIFKNGRVFKAAEPERFISFSSLVAQAYYSRIALSAYGFYKVPELDFNKVTGQGRPFLYFTQGVACSEVEIDRLSGEIKLLRSDILMDIGEPINDALDRGQIAGAFIQGVGWVTTEALYYHQGFLLSHSPSTYKIPSVHDIPRIFNIDLIENPGNAINLQGTKAVGEPPLMLCFSVWNAIKNALAYHAPFPHLPVPATAEQVLRLLNPQAFRAVS